MKLMFKTLHYILGTGWKVVFMLQEETVPKSRHVRLVAEYESTLESIRQKSKDASTVMLTAANKNEPLLK